MEEVKEIIEEKILHPKKAGGILILHLVVMIAAVLSLVFGVQGMNGGSISETTGGIVVGVSIAVLAISLFMTGGYKVLSPNEAYVFTLFGKYYGTVNTDGFYFVNPFLTSFNTAKEQVSVSTEKGKSSGAETTKKKVSLKAQTLNNEKQKVNDLEGNPIEIGVMVIWKVKNAAKAVFSVENYVTYVSTQCDSAIREIARQYPYDVSDKGDEKSLRGSSQEIADMLKKELQTRVDLAGLEIIDARITNLAYAPEIAAAMLQRQQAAAIIAARQKIVDGAVSMVDMALRKLSENNIVELDDERKAQMVSNLLVVLCGNKDAQPIVNSGSLY